MAERISRWPARAGGECRAPCGVAAQAAGDYRAAMDAFALEAGVAAAFRIIDAANEFIAAPSRGRSRATPAKADQLTQVLFDVAEAVRVAAVLLLPVMPKSAAEILRAGRGDACGHRKSGSATRSGAATGSASS